MAARRKGPNLAHEAVWRERLAFERGVTGDLVCGIDEAGRGPWAGPVVAAAVVLDPSDDLANLRAGIDDSKALDEAERDRLCALIERRAIVGIGIADVGRIDRDNILSASLWAMGRAVAALGVAPAVALVDGNRAPELPCAIETIVGGDALSLSIAAASIVAKVTRDRLMADLALRHTGYGWERNKGYGTAAHQAGIARHGLTEHHRRSFAPIRAVAEGEAACARLHDEAGGARA